MAIPVQLDLEIIPGTIFGPYDLYFEDGDFTDCVPFAEVRDQVGGRLVLNLHPFVADGPAGKITIPRITDDLTWRMKFMQGVWSLIIQFSDGYRWGPFVEGDFTIRGTATHSPE